MWTDLDRHAPIVPGRPMRSLYYFKVPYSGTLAGAMIRSVNASRGLLGLIGIEIDSAQTMSPEFVTQTPASRYKRWVLIVRWHRRV